MPHEFNPLECSICKRVDILTEIYLRDSGKRYPKPWRKICASCKQRGVDTRVVVKKVIPSGKTKSGEVDVWAIMNPEAAAYLIKIIADNTGVKK